MRCTGLVAPVARARSRVIVASSGDMPPIATPSTDPFTMTAMALPMCLLFELAVLWCFLHDRRRARREAAAEAKQLPDDVASIIDPLPERLPRPGAGGTEWTDLP